MGDCDRTAASMVSSTRTRDHADKRRNKSMKLRLTNFQSNTYEDTDGSCELCMWTGMLDHPEYEFTDSDGDTHVVEGWYSDWGHHSVIDVNVPVFTTWLHSVEFKEPSSVVEEANLLTDGRLWEEYLRRILDSAQFCGTEQELNDNLAWALLDAPTGND